MCGKKTGHAEVVQVTFDPRVIPYKTILEVLFSIHDPTTKDRRALGAEPGAACRAALLRSSQAAQRAEAAVQRAEAAPRRRASFPPHGAPCAAGDSRAGGSLSSRPVCACVLFAWRGRRQGNDVGPQYRSIIMYSNDEQKRVAEQVIQEVTDAKVRGCLERGGGKGR